MDFKAFPTSQIFGSKLKPEKVVRETRRGMWGVVGGGSGGPNIGE